MRSTNEALPRRRCLLCCGVGRLTCGVPTAPSASSELRAAAGNVLACAKLSFCVVGCVRAVPTGPLITNETMHPEIGSVRTR